MTEALSTIRRREAPHRRIAMVVKGYPRLSETFVAQELLALQQRDLPFEIWSLRYPTDKAVHPMHKAIHAPVTYLPEYLHNAPLRVLRGFLASARLPGFGAVLRQFWRDFARDGTISRIRRLGQAFVMARELPGDIGHLHVHFLHTPASVARYTALLRGISWSFSAHAKDIWTTPEWEKREKLADALWGVTCTRTGREHLNALAPHRDHVALAYHGLDLCRFPAPPEPSHRDGSDPADPVRIVSVGRAVAKKGFDDLLAALAALPEGLHWRFAHLGGGPLLDELKAQALREGIADKVAFLGPRAQPDVIALIREADLFVLPSKPGEAGDRDGLPNVIMEAASQGLAIVATDFAGIPEFIRDGREGVLVPPARWDLLANAINLLARDPARREVLGFAAADRLREDFSLDAGIDTIEARLRAALGVAVSFAHGQRDPVT
ncbi:glycosyltransferase involved in cell wall biosynthesis [Pseudochelatococcus lubricantis]|uniref:Glycosyltransferase involved in cell wall biosynthesis n=1 Tax=Pseudochelatococcus lubricantis TaxID=1538102 RepID=A0ABX0UUI9_9HYPH|nr:glycosyltransferase family 4 protein [Pseudochelatococcus lubricantis]NIJ56636.1 glycosyltransferase involved in cell wall biosynthesis [Pseudochelatococcus lubricantis]